MSFFGGPAEASLEGAQGVEGLLLISSEATRFERSESRVRVTSILNDQVAFSH